MAVDVLIHSVRKKFDKDIIQNVRGDDHQDLAMNSLRNTALVWMTSAPDSRGDISSRGFLYQLARNEAAGLIDSQLRQIALNAGQDWSPTRHPGSLRSGGRLRYSDMGTLRQRRSEILPAE